MLNTERYASFWATCEKINSDEQIIEYDYDPESNAIRSFIQHNKANTSLEE